MVPQVNYIQHISLHSQIVKAHYYVIYLTIHNDTNILFFNDLIRSRFQNLQTKLYTFPFRESRKSPDDGFETSLPLNPHTECQHWLGFSWHVSFGSCAGISVSAVTVKKRIVITFVICTNTNRLQIKHYYKK